MTRLTEGERVFSSSLPGSASTVTLIRHGLALPTRGVFMTRERAGDCKSSVEAFGLRFCLLGELAARGSLCVIRRLALAVFSLADRASGSGLESKRSAIPAVVLCRPRDAMIEADIQNVCVNC